MQDFYIALFSPNGAIYTLAVAACGAYCGHRFDFWRDRRKEFNALAEPIFSALLLQLEHVGVGLPGQGAVVHAELMVRYYGVMQRSAFRAAVSRYGNAMVQANGTYNCESGIVERTPESIAELQASIARLLKFVKPR